MPRKRAGGQTPIEDQLHDFENGPGVPKNLGNFPDELDTDPRVRLAAERPQPDPEPDDDEVAPPEPQQASQAEDVEEQPEPTQSDAERRLADLEARLQSAEREREFLRAGYQQGQQAATPSVQPGPQDALRLVDSYLGGYAVSEADVQTILQDPAKGAEYLQNGLRAAVAAGAALALAQARAEFGQFQQTQQGAAQLRDYFYGRNPDLQQFAPLVGATATQVREQYPQATPQAIADEAGRRVRETLKTMGITPKAGSSAAGGTRQRIRPASGEMGGGARGGGGGRALSPIEKQLRDFERGVDNQFGR